jgi:mannosyltransferase OCH1-like enzyme
MRADIWRFLILHHFGGVHMDLDIECRRPIDSWGTSLGVNRISQDEAVNETVNTNTSDYSSLWSNKEQINAILGLEFCDFDHLGGTGPVQIVQWTMASRPKHPIFYRAVEMIQQIASTNTEDLLNDADDAVYISGPAVFTAAVLEYLVQHGALGRDQVNTTRGQLAVIRNVTNLHCNTDTLVGDLVLLNKQALGYHQSHENSPPLGHPSIFVRHWFKGSWRTAK